MDPLTLSAAFASAQAAVAGIKKAIQLGKDINGLIGEFGRFFDAKDTLEKAANDNAKSGKSDTQLAMEIVGKRNQIREMEEHLKHTLVYGGYPEMWEQMLIERMKIKQAREKAEREERARRKKIIAQRLLIAQVVGVVITMVIILVLTGFIVKQALS